MKEMCPYCDIYADGTESLFSITREVFGTDCLMAASIEYPNIVRIGGNERDFTEIQINYCPMCGRKLERDEEFEKEMEEFTKFMDQWYSDNLNDD